jgi:hypothetical protein
MTSAKNNSQKIKNNNFGNCIYTHEKMENNYSGICFPTHSTCKNPLESSGRGVAQIHSTPPATNVTPEWSGQ